MSRWLVMGTSPSLGMVDTSLLPDGVRTVGAHRICRSYVPEFVAFDLARDMEDDEAPPVGSLRGGLVCRFTSRWAWRPDAIDFIGYDPDFAPAFQLPLNPGAEFVVGVGGGAIALQFALSRGATEIACIGVDWNAGALMEDGQPTHAYGFNPRRAIQPEAGPLEVRVWREAAEHARCVNLSPLDDTPFRRRVGWPLDSWDSWCAS